MSEFTKQELYSILLLVNSSIRNIDYVLKRFIRILNIEEINQHRARLELIKDKIETMINKE